MKLLKDLCAVHAPSGNEFAMKLFILDYIKNNEKSWNQTPQVIHGEDFQDCIILKFGKPRTAVFAHMDSIGFTVRYENQLVPIGGPQAETGYILTGEDSLGPIECELEVDEDHKLTYKFGRAIDTGTDLVFKSNFRETKDYVQNCYMDNRLGVYAALKLAETLEDGVIVFSCWEEHGGGSVPYLAKYIYEKWNIRQALIADITWVTDGVHSGKGVVVSMRDRNVPRRSYINKIIAMAKDSGVDFQLEVEGGGSSDGRELQVSPYPFDWCFIGAPEDNVHSPDEKVHKYDIRCMIELYRYLMANL
ncbi:M20/M25/M40 family metallo-hydrolase [Fulvivirga lutimaris]|uniref:M20/M25/M40 family metallo-hydrolase n=1 Tax=Fulvivirga lutimaris TaxID=1819566 RepID=UPI0012BC3752|nr:M20/M25/M40 family metallo-hydrolase [Fulvivirga lutimaris]MTI40299.1 M20/M25/M40 family metallo-hydrolase [Fulvivirga lutimaris]